MLSEAESDPEMRFAVRGNSSRCIVQAYKAWAKKEGARVMTKILVVDDEKHIRLLYSEELKVAGYEVITADSGYKLIETIAEEKPDLVILDIKMVAYNGLDILQDIRNHFYDLPVIISTAYDSFKEDMKSIAADFYVLKSSDLTELKEKIAKALETKLPG
jgi:DNA-binding NtrC family response regulator